jgi:hypothetical protein
MALAPIVIRWNGYATQFAVERYSGIGLEEVRMSAINWVSIDWVALVALSLFVLFAYNVGERLSFGSRSVGAFIAALLFAGGFAVWSYGLGSAVQDVVATAGTTGGYETWASRWDIADISARGSLCQTLLSL